MNLHEELTGVVDKFLYQNSENNYAVLVLSIGAKTAIVTGPLSHIQPGEHITINGSWQLHPKFGKQFQAASYKTHLPTSIQGLKKYLGSGLIRGIGPKYAERLVDHFGTEVLAIIDSSPHKLKNVPGIGAQRIEKIINAWQNQKDISAIMVFLHGKGVSTAYATKIYKQYGNKAVDILQENPYRLADDIWGIGFKIADEIAKNMGFDVYSIKRAVAGCTFALSNAVTSGHIYVEHAELKEKARILLEFDTDSARAEIITQALRELHNRGKITAVKDEEKYFIALAHYHAAEKWVAAKIRALAQLKPKHTFDIQKLYNSINEKTDRYVQLNEIQQQGVLTCFAHKVTVITGGPGTGKTTLVKTLLELLEQENMSYKLAAPTGRAAKRLVESTGSYALTIHRLLEYDPLTHGFKHNEQNALKLDFLIIDEASMIDINLAHALLKAVPMKAHIVFVGDIDQLPSVGAGNFLHDLIASQVVPCIKLKHIFRQAHDSLIIVNAHRVNNGEFPATSGENTKKDFFFVKEEDPEKLPIYLHKIFKYTLPRYGIAPADAMVLVPMNRGLAGTYTLNQEMQKMLNPEQGQTAIKRQGFEFKVGDRVMQIKNNYDKSVFNGDMGFIEDINTEERMVMVNFQGETLVEYELNELDELMLAYTITIHKSQGSEYPAVIIPIFMQHFMLLQRNLIYTAITRAKKLCILIGQPRAISMGINNDKGVARKTFLARFLKGEE